MAVEGREGAPFDKYSQQTYIVHWFKYTFLVYILSWGILLLVTYILGWFTNLKYINIIAFSNMLLIFIAPDVYFD